MHHKNVSLYICIYIHIHKKQCNDIMLNVFRYLNDSKCDML
jgi:hypothetical protein